MTLSSMQRQRNSGNHDPSRRRDIRALLTNSSPNNPTYILAVVLADFTSQGFTELSVKKGDEIYVMYQIDDWAYAACLTDTTMRGYIPIDYCLPVQDFFYDNPALNMQLRQKEGKEQTATKKDKVHRMPDSTRQSRRVREPIEGSETPSTVEHQYHRAYHSTENLQLARSVSFQQPNISEPKNQQSRSIRRSNTIASTFKPTVSIHSSRPLGSNQISNKTFRPPVAKKPILSSVVARPAGSKSQSATRHLMAAAKPVLPSYQTSLLSVNRNLHQPFPTEGDKTKHSIGLHTVKVKKGRGHIKGRESHSMEEHKRSLSLETVDERSELEESMNSSSTSQGGIQRLIAKFQSKIKAEHSDITGIAPRLSSADSMVSSLSEDNDSVFIDNEDTTTLGLEIAASRVKNYRSSASDEDNVQPELQLVESHVTKNENQNTQEKGITMLTKLTKQPCELGLSNNHSKGGPELQVTVKTTITEHSNKMLDLTAIESITSGSVSTDYAEESQDSLDDSLLEPPASFSSPCTSESDVVARIEATTQHAHCSCCVHYKQYHSDNMTGQLTSTLAVEMTPESHGSAIRNIRENSEEDVQFSTRPQNSALNERAHTGRRGMCDGSTQTPQNMEEVATERTRKPGRIEKASAFSRNAKLRQSRVCEDDDSSDYLLQPISPASITDDKQPPYDVTRSNRTIQQCSAVL